MKIYCEIPNGKLPDTKAGNFPFYMILQSVIFELSKENEILRKKFRN